MKKLLIIGLVILFLLMSVVNADLTTDLVSYYTFDSDASDSVGSNDGSVSGATNGASYGKINNGYNFDGTNDYISLPSGMFDFMQNNDFTLSFWVYNTDNAITEHLLEARKDSELRIQIISGKIYFKTNSDSLYYSTTLSTNTWHNVVFVFDHLTGKKIYLDGTEVASNSYTSYPLSYAGTLNTFGKRQDSVQYLKGNLDEIAFWSRALSSSEIGTGTGTLYNSGNGFQYPFSSGSTNHTIEEYTEQVILGKQTQSIDFDSNQYFSTILAGKFNLINTSNVSLNFALNVYNNQADSEYKCKIRVDGDKLESTITRTSTAYKYGSIYLFTNVTELTAGEHDVKLKCKRTGAYTTFTVDNAVGIAHILNTDNNTAINYDEKQTTKNNIATTYEQIGSFDFTTSDVGLYNTTKLILLDGRIKYSYDSDSTTYLRVSINGTNLSEYIRYGSAGSEGIGGGVRAFEVHSNSSQTLPIKIYAKSTTGDGDIDTKLIIKELILEDGSFNYTYLNNTQIGSSEFPDTYQDIKSITITNNHDGVDLVTKAGIPIQVTSGEARSLFRLKINSTTGATMYRDLSSPNQAGIAIIQDAFPIDAGHYTITLQGKTNESTVKLIGGDLISYVTGDITFTPTYFNITAKSYFNSSDIQNFSAKVLGANYETTNGTIKVIYEEDKSVNITISVDNHYTRNYTNHNTSTNLEATLYPYTQFKARAKSDNSTVNTFNITMDGVEYKTTTGILYLPTKPTDYYSLTIHDASEGSKSFAYETINLSVTSYLEDYIFYLYDFNSVRIKVYDESTGNLITKNVTIQILNNLGQTTYYTSNGTQYVSNLTAGSYTFSFNADSYQLRSYILTVNDGSTQELNAYLLNSTETVVFTTKNQATGQTIQGATYTMQTIVNNTWKTVNVRVSDIAGQASFNYNENQIYKFTVSKNTYQSKTFELNPILNSAYTIWLTPSSSYNLTDAYTGISINYYVNPTYAGNNITMLTHSFIDNSTNNFTFVISAPSGDLSSFGYTLTYKTYSTTKTGINAYGDTLPTSINISNANVLDKVILTYNYTSTISGYHEFRAEFLISNTPQNGLLINLQNEHYGLGILERVLIVIIISAIFGGLIGIFNGQIAGAFASSFVMGYFIFTGFLELWFLALPITMLFMFVVWRGD